MSPTPEILKALGPLAELYADPEIIEIMVDAPGQVLVERRMSGVEQSEVRFASPDALRAVIDDLSALCSTDRPHGETVLEMRFPEGQARALAVLPPTAPQGPHLVIRKLIFPQVTWEMILEHGAVSKEVYDLFYQAVRVPANILISGGTGSGKTTLLNRIAELIPPEERVIVAEGAHEIQATHPRALYLEAGGELSMDDVLSTASKMRPDWLVVGELLGGEAMRAIKVISNGHSALTSLHANSVQDALSRLEGMCLMANLGLTLAEIRPLIAASFQLLVNQQRLPDGRRKVVEIAELCGYEDGRYLLQPLYRFNPDAMRLEATGVQPTWVK